ncbi:transcription factor Sp5 [Nephila pilipes]|uniref:Transcription factor Sp5 n=1 Tax=Nephila pilipes TaxID=299642 RepID=A0A8X6Q3I0_NEPPI|nr:transcription factor Sp5 [Nephila pilipes]
MCHATSRGNSMAFKQVRNRPSLFRPWAFADSHTPQKKEEILNSASITSEQFLETERIIPEENDFNQTKREQHMCVISGANNNMIPSAFRSTSVSSRTGNPPLAEYLPVLKPSARAFVGANTPEMLNMDKSQISRQDMMPSAVVETKVPSRPCLFGDFVSDLPFPVTPNIGQFLEPPHTNISKLRAKKKQRPKRFQCPECRVSFSNNGQLRGHIRIHTGERPFKCDEPKCGKTFTRNEELTRHKRIHTGCRPHQCVLCLKKFGRRDHLKKHVKTHERTNVVRMPIGAFQGLSYFVSDCIPWF